MRSRSLCVAIAVALSVSAWSGSARADLSENLDNSIKGAVGGALLGANITLMIEGAAGVRNPWLLTIIPILVAGGGAAGGWVIGNASSEGSLAMLVSGLALTVPAAVLVAYARSYRASRDASEGFTDMTEEGQPVEGYDGTTIEMVPEATGVTETEVLAPPDAPANPTLPPADGGESEQPAPAGEEGGVSSLPIPALGGLGSGVLGVFAEEASRSHGPRLELSYF